MLAFVFEPGRALPRPAPGARARRGAPSRRQVPDRGRARGRARPRAGSRANLPVGYDHDGAVANEYAVVVCPTITYVRAAAGSPGRRSGRSARRRSRTGCGALSAEPPVVFARGGLGSPGVASRSQRNPLRRSPPALRRRLHALSDRHGGARAITQAHARDPAGLPRALRRRAPSPAEELTLKRLIRGQYRSRGVLRDALLIATVDTEVGVWALDADRAAAACRASRDGEHRRRRRPARRAVRRPGVRHPRDAPARALRDRRRPASPDARGRGGAHDRRGISPCGSALAA